jgi:hypothetical protein
MAFVMQLADQTTKTRVTSSFADANLLLEQKN